MDCMVHGVAKSWTQLSDFHFTSPPISTRHIMVMEPSRIWGMDGSPPQGRTRAAWAGAELAESKTPPHPVVEGGAGITAQGTGGTKAQRQETGPWQGWGADSRWAAL